MIAYVHGAGKRTGPQQEAEKEESQWGREPGSPRGDEKRKPAYLLGVLWLGAAGDLREQLRSEAEARGSRSQV